MAKILELIAAQEIDTQEGILKGLRESGFDDLTEGTLYPLLLRLERKGLIAAEYRAGSGGPSRKYYRLTPDGVQYLNEFTEAWQNASDTVNRILHDKEAEP